MKNIKPWPLYRQSVHRKNGVFVIICENQNGQWDEIGRTEVIRDNLNPEFATKFKLDYSFEKHQKYRFSVYDQDEGQKCDFLGSGFSTIIRCPLV